MRLLTWVILILLLGVTLLNLTVTIPMINNAGDPDTVFDADRLFRYLQIAIVQILGISLCALLPRYRYFKERPEVVFLLLPWVMMLLPQFIAALRGQAQFDVDIWILFYAVQALLVPVQWRLHLLSQFVVVSVFVTKFLLGMRDPDVAMQAAYFVGFTYAMIICAIADLGVFLYEGLLRREFELRQQLQVFTHAVSHDLRNPILGLVMLLKSLEKTAGDMIQLPRSVLTQMIASGDRQVALIDSLLEVHGTELHGIVLHRQNVCLYNLVSSVLADFKPFLEQHQATVDLTIPLDLPSVNIDALQVRRVYENLLSNALRHNPPGSRINLSAEVLTEKSAPSQQTEKSQWLRCTVSNDGAGMTQEQCDSMFELYARGPNRRQSLGLGLGLYICRQIITAHGGKIGAISGSAQGATFWFTLPIADLA
ncbi:MAG TPA: HAMP domain-containing sensor histidine kinase [Leptolyngbyaceae cyanobacterium]